MDLEELRAAPEAFGAGRWDFGLETGRAIESPHVLTTLARRGKRASATAS